MAVISWGMTAAMIPFFYLFLTEYFSWWLVVVIPVYSTAIMGTHGTVWFHRFGTHRSYAFSHPFWRLLTQNKKKREPGERRLPLFIMLYNLEQLRGFLLIGIQSVRTRNIKPDELIQRRTYLLVRITIGHNPYRISITI